MTWLATTRYGLVTAPGGLALVHDFLCTASMAKPRQPDLLTDLDLASEWIHEAVKSWNSSLPTPFEAPAIDERGLRALRDFRESLLTVVSRCDSEADSDLPLESQSVDLQLGHDGVVRFVPYGNDWRALQARILIEIHTAQVTDTWRRLKACRNGRCRGSFYDRSKNNSGVWHDVRSCGNAANLRTSRARRQARFQAEAAPPAQR